MNFTDEQKQIINYDGDMVVNAVAGSGKCLGKGTPVLMFNGSVVNVEHIRTGDLLMGPDSKPRRVLSIGVGFGKLYKVDPVKGDSWVCNEDHVLTLAGTNRFKQEIIDISLNHYIGRCAGEKSFKNQWKLFRVGVDFTQLTDGAINFVDPYLAGVWLGDGHTRDLAVSTVDDEIVDYLKYIAPQYGGEAIVRNDPTCLHVRIRRGVRGHVGCNKPFPIRRVLLDLFTDDAGNKIIPSSYLTASRQDRLELLAGLVDTDGYVYRGGVQFSSKFSHLVDQVLFLCRSLGFAAYKSVKCVNGVDYYQAGISGGINEIPCKIKRKIAKERKQTKRVNVTGFSITSIGDGDYYGFTLDSDGRFLLGDFTVTHNTTTLIHYAAAQHPSDTILYLAFNRSVKMEAQRKFAAKQLRHVDVMTAHGLAFRNVVAGRNVEIKSNYRPYDVAEILRIPPSRRSMERLILASHVLKLFEIYCRGDYVDVYDVDYAAYQHTSASKLFATINLVDIQENAKELFDVMRNGSVDITHDFYLKLFQLSEPKLPYSTILFDEGQDASPVMLDIFLKQRARQIIVGDENQQVYGWRNAINSLALVNYENLFLTNSFRFDQYVADLAMRVLDIKRKFVNCGDFAIKGIGGTDNDDVSRVFLARRNTTLLVRAIDELINNRNVKNVYFEGNLNSYTYADNGTSLYDILSLKNGNFDKIRDPLISSMESLDDLGEYIENTEDASLGMLITIVNKYGNDIYKIMRQLKDAHVGDQNKRYADAIFSTVHKCKGMEYSTVTLEDDFISEYVVDYVVNEIPGNELHVDKLAEELNLLYVAVTRSRRFVRIPGALIPSGFGGHPNVVAVPTNQDDKPQKAKIKLDSYRKVNTFGGVL